MGVDAAVRLRRADFSTTYSGSMPNMTPDPPKDALSFALDDTVATMLAKGARILMSRDNYSDIPAITGVAPQLELCTTFLS